LLLLHPALSEPELRLPERLGRAPGMRKASTSESTRRQGISWLKGFLSKPHRALSM
jgi:hypothetical protein